MRQPTVQRSSTSAVSENFPNFRKIAKYLSFQPQYNRDDFIVEYLPTLEVDLPKVTIGGRSVPDISLLAPDCFHFMKELHGRLGR